MQVFPLLRRQSIVDRSLEVVEINYAVVKQLKFVDRIVVLREPGRHSGYDVRELVDRIIKRVTRDDLVAILCINIVDCIIGLPSACEELKDHLGLPPVALRFGHINQVSETSVYDHNFNQVFVFLGEVASS